MFGPTKSTRAVLRSRTFFRRLFNDLQAAPERHPRCCGKESCELIWNLRRPAAVKPTMNTPRPLLLPLLLASSSVLAQSGAVAAPDEPPVEVRYEKRTVVACDGVDVVGSVAGPTGSRVVGRKRPTFRSLVALRPNFRDALSSTSTSPVVTP